LSPVTPEKLAWIVLWSRAYTLLQAVRDLYESHGARGAVALDRPAFELQLQVELISRPRQPLSASPNRRSALSTGGPDRTNDRWSEITDRLRGFAAWALTHDLVFFRRRLADWELRRVYQPTDRRTVPESSKEQALLEYLFGPSEILSQAESDLDRQRAEQSYLKTVGRIEEWLADPLFGHWTAVDLASWIRGDNGKPLPSLFRLLEGGGDSAWAYLKNRGDEELYAVYSRTSMILHGSSILEFAKVGWGDGDGVIVPSVLPYSPEDRDRLCEFSARMCNHAVLGLWSMRDKCIGDR
jgi:hypothetical protein